MCDMSPMCDASDAYDIGDNDGNRAPVTTSGGKGRFGKRLFPGLDRSLY